MPRPDDSSLPPDRLAAVRREADRALRAADAFGVFPTPVSAVMKKASVVLAPADALTESRIQRFRNKAGSALKRALSKVLGVLDAAARLIYIDRTVHVVKQTFLKLHETAHAILPWQRDIYAVVEDCKKTIDPQLADEFDREANVFASEVLFQCDTFTQEAADHDFGIKTPLRLSKKYGASIYSSVRRYVRTHTRSCTVLVLNEPQLVPGDGFVTTLRRVEASESFLAHFGSIPWPDRFTPDDQIGALVPVGGRRMSGRHEITLTDANGVEHECLAEAFTQTYQVFVLIHPVHALTRSSIVVPR